MQCTTTIRRLAAELTPSLYAGTEPFILQTQGTIMRIDTEHCFITTDLGKIPTNSSIPDLGCHIHENQNKSAINSILILE